MKILVAIVLFFNFLFADKLSEVKMFTEHYPPYNYEKNGKLQGMAIDVLDAILKQMNSSLSLDDVTLTNWSRAYSIALKKKNAVVFATTRIESREKHFKWVGPIGRTAVGLIALKEKNINIDDIKELNNYKIGAVLKDVGELLLLDNGVKKSQIQYVKGKNAIDISFKKMQNDRIDLFAYDINVALTNAKLRGFDIDKYEIVHTLKTSELYFAFNKNSDEKIIKKWQNALDKIKQNGTYYSIMKKYK